MQQQPHDRACCVCSTFVRLLTPLAVYIVRDIHLHCCAVHTDVSIILLFTTTCSIIRYRVASTFTTVSILVLYRVLVVCTLPHTPSSLSSPMILLYWRPPTRLCWNFISTETDKAGTALRTSNNTTGGRTYYSCTTPDRAAGAPKGCSRQTSPPSPLDHDTEICCAAYCAMSLHCCARVSSILLLKTYCIYTRICIDTYAAFVLFVGQQHTYIVLQLPNRGF